VEGQNIEIEYRWAEGREERLPELAALPVEIIVSSLVVPALVARDASSATPIVFGAMNDPVGTGLADSLARPGGNITGLSQASGLLDAKRVELLKDAVPPNPVIVSIQ
jgi:putative ABC transport system substrate-binding protein